MTWDIFIAYFLIGIVFTVVMLVKDGDLDVSSREDLMYVILGMVMCTVLWPIAVLMLICGGDKE